MTPEEVGLEIQANYQAYVLEIMTEPKVILIIAGPNGAGKTSFARSYLLNEATYYSTFINADMVAAGLNPFHPERPAFVAGRIMLRMIDEHVLQGESFAFETTLSGRSYAGRFRTGRHWAT